MSLLSMLGISTAAAAPVAANTAVPPEGGFLSMLPMLIIFIAIFYFLLIRPQQKRAKEQKQLLDNLAVGDEVLTAGGVVGRLTRLRDNFIVLTVSKDVEVILQKSAIASVLPKGTLDSVH
jgi:preprotein translocase subunit YajC